MSAVFRLSFIAEELLRRRGRALRVVRAGELRLVHGDGGARVAAEVRGAPGRLTDPWRNVVRLEAAR